MGAGIDFTGKPRDSKAYYTAGPFEAPPEFAPPPPKPPAIPPAPVAVPLPREMRDLPTTGPVAPLTEALKELDVKTTADGKYSVPADKGLPPGKYTVRISAAEDAGAAPTGPPGPESMTQQAKALIPPQYNVETTLSAEVTEGGSNVFDFDLK